MLWPPPSPTSDLDDLKGHPDSGNPQHAMKQSCHTPPQPPDPSGFYGDLSGMFKYTELQVHSEHMCAYVGVHLKMLDPRGV